MKNNNMIWVAALVLAVGYYLLVVRPKKAENGNGKKGQKTEQRKEAVSTDCASCK